MKEGKSVVIALPSDISPIRGLWCYDVILFANAKQYSWNIAERGDYQ